MLDKSKNVAPPPSTPHPLVSCVEDKSSSLRSVQTVLSCCIRWMLPERVTMTFKGDPLVGGARRAIPRL